MKLQLDDEERQIVIQALQRLREITSRNTQQRKYGRIIDLLDRVYSDA